MTNEVKAALTKLVEKWREAANFTQEGDCQYPEVTQCADELQAELAALPKQREPVAYHYYKVLGEHTAGRRYDEKRSQWHLDQGWTETLLYAHPAPVSKEPGEARKMSAIPIECYDGLAVYKAMTPIQLGRNSPETVSDVLDALVKLIRDNARKESAHE